MNPLEKLADLLLSAPCRADGSWDVQNVAKHLLKNGVLVPPCKTGDQLWWYCDDDPSDALPGDISRGVYEYPERIRILVYDGTGWGVVMDGDVLMFGTQYAMLSREDAEGALEKSEEQNNNG